MNNVTQYGTLFVAFGCVLKYSVDDARLEVKDVPRGSEDLIDEVLTDIDKFEDCANYLDGASALCLAEYLDDAKNPLPAKVRDKVLHNLGIKKDGKFIYQVLSLQKNNRSWHFSDVANDCSHFHETCTHRGIEPNPERKGRRSSRMPEDYHKLNAHGMITREQLVTPSLETLFQSIGEDNLVSGQRVVNVDVDLKQLKKLDINQKLRVIRELQESVA